MAAPLPVAVIGAGSIGRRHIDVVQACPSTILAVVIEPQAEQRERLAGAGLPVAARIDDAPAQVRAAIIATPTPAHYMATLSCLARGWAVLVEKPIAATLDEAREMIAAAEDADLPLVVGHHRRCHPFSITARAALDQIGNPVGVQGLWSLRKHAAYFDAEWRKQPGAGPLMTNLSHEIDLLHFLLGGITEVSALLSSARRGLAIEDTAALALRLENGVLGSFLMSDAGASPWAFEAACGENPAIAASGEDYLRITGTAGALAFPSLTRWGGSGSGEVEWSKPLARSDGPGFSAVDPLQEQIARFAAVVAGGEDDVLCSGRDGLRALEMTLAAALSGRDGRPVRAGSVPGDFNGV